MRYLLLISLLAISTFTALTASANPNKRETALQSLTNQWQKQNGLVGLSAACVTPGATITSASGSADGDSNIPITPTHTTYVGSVTKMFTAAAILLLVENGKLQLDDLLSRWYPSYPNAQSITIRQLLAMTAGTYDYFRSSPDNPMIPLIMENILREWSPEEIIEVASAVPPHTIPGQQFWYSNTNYILLGRIIESISGTSLGTFFNKHLFKPSGLKNTVLGGAGEHYKELASGYLRGSAFLFGRDMPFASKREDYVGLESLGWAAGGLISNSEDLAQWVHSLFSGRIVHKDLLAEMTRPGELVGDGSSHYGLGVEVFETKHGLALGHPGSLPGYASMTLYFPHDEVAVSVVTNDESGEQYLKTIAVEIASDICRQ